MNTPEIIEYYVPSELQFGNDIFKNKVSTEDPEYVSHTEDTVTVRECWRSYGNVPNIIPDSEATHPRHKVDAIKIQMECLMKIRNDMNKAIVSLDNQLREEAAKNNPYPKVSDTKFGAFCTTCGGVMVLNVPRIGGSAGYVHRDTGKFYCGPVIPLEAEYSSQQEPLDMSEKQLILKHDTRTNQ